MACGESWCAGEGEQTYDIVCADKVLEGKGSGQSRVGRDGIIADNGEKSE